MQEYPAIFIIVFYVKRVNAATRTSKHKGTQTGEWPVQILPHGPILRSVRLAENKMSA